MSEPAYVELHLKIIQTLANLAVAAFDKSSIFDLNINDDIYKDWKPPGELLRTLTTGDSTYEIWKGSLADKAIQQMVKRIQILIPLFIEGGTAINLNDPEWSLQRWTVFLLYKKVRKRQPQVDLHTSSWATRLYTAIIITNYPHLLHLQRKRKHPLLSRQRMTFKFPFPTQVALKYPIVLEYPSSSYYHHFTAAEMAQDSTKQSLTFI